MHCNCNYQHNKLQDSITEEKTVWDNVAKLQVKYNMGDPALAHLMEIFDLIDVSGNGKLKFIELVTVLNLLSVTEADQFTYFMLVDKDSSGQIDFGEFIELMYV